MNRQTGIVRLLAATTLLLAAAPLYAAGRQVDVAQHGKRMTLGTGSHSISVLYLKGTPYQMGYAEGKLCAKEVRYFVTQVEPIMILGMQTTPQRIDAIWKLYAKHLRPEYIEELKGISDGSGVSLQQLYRISAIPDISQWSCSFFAADGKATASGGLIQIRALDYTMDAGIQKYPALIVYKPSTGIPFVNVGWLGMSGLVTGMNADGIAMSEIGDDWDKATNNFDGRPLTYVMRDSIQFGKTLDQAVNLVKDHSRSLSILYCLSSGKTGQVRALQTSHTQCYVYTPSTLPFPTKPGMVYMSMGMDSSWNKKLGNALHSDYGKITVPVAENVMHTLGTGSLQATVFKPATGDLWVANAIADQKAYNEPFLHFNLLNALKDPFFRASGASDQTALAVH